MRLEKKTGAHCLFMTLQVKVRLWFFKWSVSIFKEFQCMSFNTGFCHLILLCRMFLYVYLRIHLINISSWWIYRSVVMRSKGLNLKYLDKYLQNGLTVCFTSMIMLERALAITWLILTISFSITANLLQSK